MLTRYPDEFEQRERQKLLFRFARGESYADGQSAWPMCGAVPTCDNDDDTDSHSPTGAGPH